MAAAIIKDLNELPATLRVKDIQNVLGISYATTCSLVHSEGFPLVRIGSKRIVIPKQAFIEWLERSAGGMKL